MNEARRIASRADRGPAGSDGNGADPAPPDTAGPGRSARAADGAPVGPVRLFLVFSRMGLSGFGGVLPWAYRILVERERLLSDAEFMDALALGQLLPGPNICNVSIMIGHRFAGWRGAVAALAGLLGGPFLIVIGLGALHARFGDLAPVKAAVGGMAAVAAGLVLTTGVKLARRLPRRAWPWLLTGATAIGVGVLRLPLPAVLGASAPIALALAWRDTRGGAS